jgi:hypothetical protein
VTVWIAARDYSKNYSLTPDSYALSNVAPDMSAITPHISAVKHGRKKTCDVNWKSYTQPEDIEGFNVYASATSPAALTAENLKATVGKGVKHKTIPGLSAAIKYDWRIEPIDTFGIGTATN